MNLLESLVWVERKLFFSTLSQNLNILWLIMWPNTVALPKKCWKMHHVWCPCSAHKVAFQEVQEKVLKLINKDTIMIGHSLGIDWGYSMISREWFESIENHSSQVRRQRCSLQLYLWRKEQIVLSHLQVLAFLSWWYIDCFTMSFKTARMDMILERMRLPLYDSFTIVYSMYVYWEFSLIQ